MYIEKGSPSTLDYRHRDAPRSTDPGLTALSFRHTSAEMLVQEPKWFDDVCSMEVVEHVDSPATFLRSRAELIKIRFLAAFLLVLSTIFVDMRFRLCIGFHSLSFLAAWRTPFPSLPLRSFISSPSWQPRMCSASSSLGTRTFSKFDNPDGLFSFFVKPLMQGACLWISRTDTHGLATRVEVDVLGFSMFGGVVIGP